MSSHQHGRGKISRKLSMRSKRNEMETCRMCSAAYCKQCLYKYRFPGEQTPPQVCTTCFPDCLIQKLFPDLSLDEYRGIVASYTMYHHLTESPNPHDNEEMKAITGDNGFFATKVKVPKVPASAKVLDKVAIGMFRMSGMYEGGKFTRKYVTKASKRKVKYVEPVAHVQSLSIQVPYRYKTDDYDFEKYNLDPNVILKPEEEGEPESYALGVKVYSYVAPGTSDRPLPVLIWMHGGGFIMGDVEDSVLHRTMSRFCNMLRGVVVNVNYRLAPEFKWPTQPEDSYSVLEWVASPEGSKRLGIDPNLITVGGDSAGGSLSTVLSIMTKLRKGPKIIHQITVYPGVHAESTDTESYKKYGNGPFLRLSLLRWFKSQLFYAPDSNCGIHHFASPLLYDDLTGLPPLTMITAGFCPLTDHAKEYAQRYHEFQIPVNYTEYSSSFHGFYHSFSPESIAAITQTGILLRLHVDIAQQILYGSVAETMNEKIHPLAHEHNIPEEDFLEDESSILEYL